MLTDLKNGNRLELPWLSGGVTRMAKKFGLEVPVNQTIEAAVKLYESGKPELYN